MKSLEKEGEEDEREFEKKENIQGLTVVAGRDPRRGLRRMKSLEKEGVCLAASHGNVVTGGEGLMRELALDTIAAGPVRAGPGISPRRTAPALLTCLKRTSGLFRRGCDSEIGRFVNPIASGSCSGTILDSAFLPTAACLLSEIDSSHLATRY
ncbi:hypothetical protein NE237_012247 [Protea cynaroides]|uniref:Uncharacterized protein n=1 Tax=Protea cynaroides TaxID=273540 RepID=A0A9Q0H1H1_9MAGN|nr:hypothetical protein NE237_012247 [Protea cynaroides]